MRSSLSNRMWLWCMYLLECNAIVMHLLNCNVTVIYLLECNVSVMGLLDWLQCDSGEIECNVTVIYLLQCGCDGLVIARGISTPRVCLPFYKTGTGKLLDPRVGPQRGALCSLSRARPDHTPGGNAGMYTHSCTCDAYYERMLNLQLPYSV